jgi:hypothetical protein
MIPSKELVNNAFDAPDNRDYPYEQYKDEFAE